MAFHRSYSSQMLLMRVVHTSKCPTKQSKEASRRMSIRRKTKSRAARIQPFNRVEKLLSIYIATRVVYLGCKAPKNSKSNSSLFSYYSQMSYLLRMSFSLVLQKLDQNMERPSSNRISLLYIISEPQASKLASNKSRSSRGHKQLAAFRLSSADRSSSSSKVRRIKPSAWYQKPKTIDF